MDQATRRLQPFPVPPVIRRNITLFALAQSFTGAGMSFAYGIGPLMVVALTHSASLAGLSVALLSFSRFIVSYPVGKITDVYGRRPGILLGLILAAFGAVTVGLSMTWHSASALIFGMLVFGMGMYAAQQLRVAATDMFPPHMRATSLGYIALGSLAGLLLSPVLIGISERMSSSGNEQALGLPWLMLPVFIVGGMVLVGFARPDPKEIGMNLQRYYPDYTPQRRAEGASSNHFSIARLFADVPTRLAIIANAAATGNMSIVMVLTSLVLSHHGHSLTAIGLSHMFHSAGMFAFTVPLGKIADRYGRERVMFPGVAVALVGAILVSFTQLYLTITLGTFLVGLGWAAANVAGTALIADHAETEQRGRAIGVSDSFAAGISIVMALGTGPLIERYGLPAAGMMAIVVAAVPLAMLATGGRAHRPAE